MRFNEVTYGRLETPFKVNGNLKLKKNRKGAKNRKSLSLRELYYPEDV